MQYTRQAYQSGGLQSFECYGLEFIHCENDKNAELVMDLSFRETNSIAH